MPTIAIVEGVRIVIFLNDHLPALFAGQEAKLSIATGEVLSGTLPRETQDDPDVAGCQPRRSRLHLARDPSRTLQRRDDRVTPHRIAAVEALDYPTLRITFDDGLGGILNLSDLIADGPVFAPLKDEAYFRTVAIGEHGWNLDVEGEEIDFCPDATRIRIETQIVEDLASRFETRRIAAA
ncbi:DUF2442 domain-containing protein [Methylobacterium sp. J-030]|uniref:DUF2442 domain-containing protein n=1 Tax=Methylobacterium sp. J-030 TaxID=2836627 RepID=UPI001FBA767B|nr:DUF2442 domain-containing protein [Methylobacterium sp. J-030]MCJ2068827.1 DUF2442 domain-containing protein [Methylobacterium sp. J-030]